VLLPGVACFFHELVPCCLLWEKIILVLCHLIGLVYIYGCILPGRGGATGGRAGAWPPNAPINTNLPLIKSKKSVKNLEN
jgi:hypothetical protein